MKLSFALQKRRRLTRSEAWGCLTANLAVPGSGSLVAGYAIGYAQLISSLVGFVLFTLTSLRFLNWYVANWQHLTSSSPLDDPFSNLIEVMSALKWPGLSALFVAANILWALITSWQILRESPKLPPTLPPRLF